MFEVFPCIQLSRSTNISTCVNPRQLSELENINEEGFTVLIWNTPVQTTVYIHTWKILPLSSHYTCNNIAVLRFKKWRYGELPDWHKTWDFYSDEDPCHSLLGYDVMQWCGRIPMFQRVMLPPSQPVPINEDWNLYPACLYLSHIHPGYNYTSSQWHSLYFTTQHHNPEDYDIKDWYLSCRQWRMSSICITKLLLFNCHLYKKNLRGLFWLIHVCCRTPAR
jgi:hypothetical protein